MSTTAGTDTSRGRGTSRRTSGRRPATVVTVALGLTLAVLAALLTTSRGADGGTLSVSYDRDSQVLDFRGPTFAGGTVDSEELRGRPVVLNFYASWCTVCDRELPDFQRVAERLDGRVQVLGINPQSNDTTAAQSRMIERAGITYPTLPDPTDELLRQFNTTGGLPTTVFVSADGVVRKVHNGLLTEQLLLDEIAASLDVQV
jgi:cytochrome c biogenesis protein CcmG/thiol:disulfide interchange protein DsbE